MGLFKPSWSGNDEKRALKAVEKTTDKTKLCIIVREARHVGVRCAAIRKLNDQRALADIAIELSRQEPNEATVRITDAILERLTTDYLIEKVAREASGCVSQRASLKFEKLFDDQPAIAEVARKTDDYGMAINAARKLTDRSLMIEVAKTAKIEAVRDFSSSKITDQNALKIIYMHSGDFAVLKRISDRDILKEIAGSDIGYSHRRTIIGKLDDEAFFETLKRERCHEWEELNPCVKRCKICGKESGEHSYVETGDDIYTGATKYRCSVCGDIHSEYTSMGWG